MKFTENRRLACIVLAVVIAASIIVQGGYAILNKHGDIEESFMTGTPHEQTERCRSSAALLATAVVPYLSEGTVGQYCSESTAAVLKEKGYLEAASLLEEQSTALKDAKNPTACIAALTVLTETVEKVYSGISMLDLTEDQMQDITLAYYDYKGGLDILTRNDGGYNELAASFNRDISGFPASLIAGLWHASKLPLIGG